jgi:ferredoxin
MGTGPQAASGFDLALTEVLADGRHYFVAEAGNEGAEELLAALPGRETTDGERDAAAAVVERAAGQMGRRLETDGLAEALLAAYEHPHWEAVARRCLSCGNCTLVCPTCFCSTVEDASALAGGSAERWRRWDSCFSVDFSYLHGGSVRTSTASRYRQWLTHKLATWQQQFGTAGCVGCGRCISWCPVGIDITQEAAALRSNEGGQGARHA